MFDTLALNLNIVAKTTVPWQFECILVCKAVGTGTSTTFFPTSWFASEAVVGAPLPAAGGNGTTSSGPSMPSPTNSSGRRTTAWGDHLTAGRLLRRIRERYPTGPITVVWDNARYQHTALVRSIAAYGRTMRVANARFLVPSSRCKTW